MRDLAVEFMLDPNIHFLNHGSFGACPRSVFDDYQRWQRELEAQPVEFLGRRFDGLMAEARRALAGYVCCDPDDLVYVPNATQGVNIVARSLALAPGDEVLASDHEYGALNRTWEYLCEKQGAQYRRVEIPVPVSTEADFVERVWNAVTPRTRVLFLSHITSPTALIFPVQELVRRARTAGILTIIDGAHAAGQLPLDLGAPGADFYSANCHKWMLGPKGSAFLYARRELQGRVEPLVVSWGWRPEKPAASRFVQEQEWQGTRDIAAFLAVPAAIRFMQANDWESVRAECHALAVYAQAQLAALTGLEPLSDESWFSQMVSCPLPPCDIQEVKARLYDEHRIEVPVLLWNGQPLIRISLQAYNSRADVDALTCALKQILGL
jgi:isopenicillin-N epimerase